MELEEVQAARIREIEGRAAPGSQFDQRTASERMILALQRSAGNRAVGSLLAHAPRTHGAGRVPPIPLPVQRGPNGPGEEEEPWPEESVPRPVLWPEEAEGERNEPCFSPDAQSAIADGAYVANRAADRLVAKPPDLWIAVAHLRRALVTWEGADGADPGQRELTTATDWIRKAAVQVSAYVEPAERMLVECAAATRKAVADVGVAATSMTEPESAGEEPEPCFGAGQKATIAKVVAGLSVAANEFDKRPPDYQMARTKVQGVFALLDIEGLEPGRTVLRVAYNPLTEVLDAMDAYLTPVGEIVATAAEYASQAATKAREASEMSKRGKHAAAGGAEAAGAGPSPSAAGGAEPPAGGV